jgi:predicted permease
MRLLSWFYTIPLRFRSLFRRGDLEQELDDELRDHIERGTEENMSRGVGPEEARRRALLAMDGVERAKEECRDQRRVGWIEDFQQDLHFGLRMLVRRPLFALMSVGIIALGIAANTAIVSVVRTALAERLPFRDIDRLMMLWQQDMAHDRDRVTLTAAEYRAYRDTVRGFASVAAARPTAFTATGDNGAFVLQGARVSVNLLSTLGTAPAAGRDFRQDEDRPGNDNVALLSHSVWVRQFAQDPAIIGRRFILDESAAQPGTESRTGSRASYTIIGILPPNFDIFYTHADVITPLDPPTTDRDGTARGLRVVGRLGQGASRSAALDELRAAYRQLANADPQPNQGTDITLIPLRDEEIGDIRPTMIALLCGAGLVLLVVCANVSNLLLARIAERDREMSVRLALGARLSRLVLQVMTEGLLLSFLGVAVGLWLSWWMIEALIAYAPSDVLRLTSVRMDRVAMAATALIALCTCVVCSWIPAMQGASRIKHLPTGGRTTQTRERQRGRRLLVAAQIALACVSATGAVLVAQSFLKLRDAHLGFRPERTFTFRIAPSASEYSQPALRSALYRRVLNRLRILPGVEAVGAINILPITDADQSMAITAPGSEFTNPNDPAVVKFRAASPGLFRALGVPVLNGREFNDSDVDSGSAVISELLARQLWNTSDVIGRQIAIHLTPNQSRVVSIVGVVGDLRQFRDTAPHATLYSSTLGQSALTFAVRTNVAIDTFSQTVQHSLAEVDSSLAAYDMRGMADRVETAGQFTTGRFRAVVGIAFGASCFLLAIIGVYGVVAFLASQQTREIGIRMAIGATPTVVMRWIVVNHLWLATVGALVGGVLSVVAAHLLATVIYEVTPYPVAVPVAVSLCLVIGAVVAAWLPARRAAAVDPILALRSE